MAMPLQHEDVTVVAVTTIDRQHATGPLSEGSLGPWLDVLRHADKTIARLCFIELARHALHLPWFCSGETATTAFWAEPEEAPRRNVFVVMPFAQKLEKVRKAIEKAGASLKLSVIRGDDFFSAQVVMADVWRGILNADVIVADCSGRNANVFYEVGLCHVIGKQVILLAQRKHDVPFDINAWRYITYDVSAPGMRKLERSLVNAFTQLGLGNSRSVPAASD